MNILLIEDDQGIAMLVKECLEDSYPVVWAANFDSADVSIEEHVPELMIIDYRIGYTDTAEGWLTQRVNLGKPIPPFIISTGQGDERVAVSLMKLGARDYLIKDGLFLERLPEIVKRVKVEIENEAKLKQIEAALKEEEVKYRLLVENSGMGVSLFDSEGKILFLNSKASSFMGVDIKDAIGKNAGEVLQSEKSDLIHRRIFETLAKDKSHEYTDFVEKKNKEVLWYMSNYTPVKGSNGQTLGVQVLHHDITARVKAEMQIRKISDFYQSVIENAPDGVVVVNAEGNFIFVSPSAYKMFSYTEQDVKRLKPMEMTHPDDRDIMQYTMAELFKNPQYSPTIEYRFLAGNGDWIWIESRFSNMLHNENIQGIVINFRNVTERKKTDEQLRQKMEELIRFQRITVGRELAMIELKKEVNDLLTDAGKVIKYSIVTEH